VIKFEKGDLVTFGNGKPGVLFDLPHWYTGKSEYEDFVSGKRGDSSDMCAYVYWITESGRLELDIDFKFPIFKMEYYRGELQGQERFLKYLGQYIKNKDENLAWLIDLFCKFKLETEQQKVNELFHGWYRSLEKEERM
jgi:hypothetical protein